MILAANSRKQKKKQWQRESATSNATLKNQDDKLKPPEEEEWLMDEEDDIDIFSGGNPGSEIPLPSPPQSPVTGSKPNNDPPPNDRSVARW